MDPTGLVVGAVILVVVIIVIYVATAPKFNIALTAGGTQFEDSFIKVSFPISNPVNLRSIKQIDFTIENKTTAPINMEWDSCAFVDPSGETGRIMHSGVKFTNRDAVQPPTIIGSKSKKSDMVLPADNVYWREGSDKVAGGWEQKTLLKSWASRDKFEFKVILTMKIANESKPYEFSFNAVKAA